MRLTKGETLRKTADFFIGSLQRPMTREQVLAKFRNLASRSLSAGDTAKIEEIVFDLEHASEVTTLSRVLRGARRSAA